MQSITIPATLGSCLPPLSRTHLSVFVSILLVGMMASLCNGQSHNDLILSDFENNSLTTQLNWNWSSFSSDNNKSIKTQINKDTSGNHFLIITGSLPKGSPKGVYGGVFCAYDEIERKFPRNFSPYGAIAFKAASDKPSYYSVRLEDREIGYNSSNIVFPVTQKFEEYYIPLSEFKTGVTQCTAIAFTRFVDTPGAPFNLALDDVRFVTQVPPNMKTPMDSFAEWAPSPEIGWQNAIFHNKPLLLYFISSFAMPCQTFEAELIKEQQFPIVSKEYVLARIDVNENRGLAQRYKVWRVPTFIVFEPNTGRYTNLLSAGDGALLVEKMKEYLKDRPEKSLETNKQPPAKRYSVVTIDDFADRNDINELAGSWGTFATNNQGTIHFKFIDLGGGNLALEGFGKYPSTSNGLAYGGIYCDLSQNRSVERNMTNFRWVSFISKSSRPSVFQVHLEDKQGKRSEPQQFKTTTEPMRTTLMTKNFGPVAKQAVTMVWTEVNPIPGADFELILDEITVIH